MTAANAASPGWSADGNWFWDGERWNDAVSQDGKWRFDGSNWAPFGGERTPMPIPIPPPPPSPSTQGAQPQVPAPAVPPVPAMPEPAAMPSWVASSEVERIEREKQERAALAAQPVEPLPPQLDWRRAGEFIQYSHTVSTPFWRSGYTSLFLYLGLLWLCSPIALAYVWLTEWRLSTKVYRTVICCIWISALATYMRSRYGL